MQRGLRIDSGDQGQPLFSSKPRAGDFDEPVVPANPEYRYRWCIITSFVLVSSSMGLSVSSIQIIATATKQIYGEDAAVVNLFASSFFLSGLIFNFPASFVLRHYTIKCSLITGVCFTILGAWVRVFINYNFRVAVAGQCLVAVAFSFFFNAPSQIAARWFLPKNRGMATIIMSVSASAFSCLITPISTLAIDKEPSDIPPSEYSHYRERMLHYEIGLAIYATISCIMGLIFFQEYPPTPVTEDQHVEREPVWKSTKGLLTNCAYMLAIVSFALSAGSFNGLHLLAQQILKKYGLKSKNLANMNMIELPVLIVSMVVYGYVYRRVGHAKPILVFNMAVLLALIVFVWAVIETESTFLICVILVSQIAFSSPSLGLSLQLAADITFPISEAVSAGLLFIAVPLISFALTEGLSPLVDRSQSATILLILLACQGLSFLFILFVKEPQNGGYSDPDKEPKNKRKILM